MLSIIVSTYNPTYFSKLEKNVIKTIGDINFEIIKIDNDGKIGLCQAYNIGATKSKFPNLLFIYDNIEFVTTDWGYKLLVHLNKHNVGVVGVAGSTFKTKMLSGWFQNPVNAKIFTRANIIQSFKYNQKPDQKLFVNPNNLNIEEVSTVDGVFMAVKKSVLSDIDEKLLRNYHGYDLDFSLSVGQYYKNYVCFDILCKHFSEGNPDFRWECVIKKIHD